MPRREKRYHFLYKTTNLLNGKFYVGMHSTDDMDDGYLGSGLRLRRSIRKYGATNFKREVLEFFESRKILIEREKNLVDENLLKDPFCLNIREGGEGGLISEAHHLKMRAGARLFALKQWSDPVFKKMMRELTLARNKKYKPLKACDWNGRKHRDETKKKIGKTNAVKQLGKNNSQYGTVWITNGRENKKIKIENLDLWIIDGWYKGRV